MAPYTNIPLSPAELAYLHASLRQQPPVRPDGRSPTRFRPLVAESDILPATNGSARICFADGTEAVVGVRADVERARGGAGAAASTRPGGGLATGGTGRGAEEDGARNDEKPGRGEAGWIAIAVEIPGVRDDDALPVFLAAMLGEALAADAALKDRLCINARFHWRLYVDVLLLSQPLSYPLPLLSLTTHLALLNTRLPALVSQGDEDPLFDDDWAAATPLYPSAGPARPPVTLLLMSVGETVLFDPSREELAVADAVLAVSVARRRRAKTDADRNADADAQADADADALEVVAMRTVDPPSRLTAAGVPRDLSSAGGAGGGASSAEALARRERDESGKVWRPPRGGLKRGLLARMVRMVVEEGGVGWEVLEALGKVGS